MRDEDPTLIDKIKFPDELASKITRHKQHTYKYFKEGVIRNSYFFGFYSIKY